MNSTVWKNIGRFVLLMLLQLLVLNQVYMGGYIMPEIYLLFVLMLPTRMPRVAKLATAFATGLIVDIMAGTLGFHALACTIVAMSRILFADRILTRGEEGGVENPGIRTVAPQYFITYLLLMYAIFFLVLYLTEVLTFRGIADVLIATVASSLVSTLLAIVYQVIFTRKEKNV